jgi:tetratricopeptide (TPR) repeat protein
MTKENFLFGSIGLLLGLIIGFMFANSVNQSAVTQMPGAMSQNPNMPPGHPEVPGNGNAMSPQIQTLIDKAKAEPDNFEAQMKAAEVFYQIQRYEGAIEYLKQANKLKPDDYQTIVNLGNSYFDAGDYAEAEKWYSSALAKKPEDINVRTDMGLTFIFREPPNYDRAIREFTRSLEKDPNHPQTLQNMTVAYTKKGDAAKAKDALARLEGIDSTNAAIPKLREEIQKLETK